jgi:tetratricopeptide (TPR) repeat protein
MTRISDSRFRIADFRLAIRNPRFAVRNCVIAALIIATAALTARLAAQHSPRAALPAAAEQPARITIDYPPEGSIFPPEFPAPLFLWRDTDNRATLWVIDVTFAGHSAGIRVKSRGEGMRIGEIDSRCVAPTNKPPRLTPEQAAAHTWRPDAETWAAIKRRSTNHLATLTITGYRNGNPDQAVSRGQVAIQTSTDPVGAPIFYRDVPLMPSETEKGVIKPLAENAMPLIAWRLRSVGETRSRLLMEGIHSCANCHSVSRDGKTMGLDIDGPLNDKGLYAIVPIKPHMSIRNEDVVAWSTFRGKLGGKLRVGFMSQVSPDGQYVVTTINDPGEDQSDYQRRKHPKDLVSNYYVANFNDYRFLQVFYPTRGMLAWYNRTAGVLQPLPGADDPRYVHTSAVWGPDGKYLVFARAEAQDAYPTGAKPAESANDPNETQIKYDLYRIPFNDGRGGRPEPIAGASGNGMSNSFPKVSPDGRWIVYVQCRNGQLMRPDSQLYIVPAAGGEARRMRCNTPLMNSWHSFSPNGRWLVFSSKSWSPYTQMFLTHLDESGNDSPAILIESATAANRAVNIPEFVNIPPDGLLKIDAPATDYFRVIDIASELATKRQYEAAIVEWKKALELSPSEPLVHFNLANALREMGRGEEAIMHYERALEVSPDHAEAHNNLGNALVRRGRLDEAITHFEKALETNPDNFRAHTNLAAVLAQRGRIDQAIAHVQKAIEYEPDDVDAQNNLGLFLTSTGRPAEAIPHLERAVRLSGGQEVLMLNLLSSAYADVGRFTDAIQTGRQALAIATRQHNYRLVETLKASIALYESRTPLPKR